MLKYPFYLGNRSKPVKGSQEGLPKSARAYETRPQQYIPDDGLRDAVNVALLLNQPLLLTGEPGTGKTLLAYSVAWELGFDEPLRFQTKSTSTARDLFYSYDALGRFHKDLHSTRVLDYITFNALGKAILRSREREIAAQYLLNDQLPPEPQRSVVLIDEIDKAPRDFPNDVLGELEGMYFHIPELGNQEIRVNPDRPPIVFITSNSEKHLPDAFLRRCVYYHIPFPDKVRLKEIVTARLGGDVDLENDFLLDALDLFYEFRKPSAQIHKKPSTAELLAWVIALRRMAADEKNPLRFLGREQVLSSLDALMKTPEDRDSAAGVLKRWEESKPNATP